MSDLIDREALLKDIDELESRLFFYPAPHPFHDVKEVMQFVLVRTCKRQPAVDAVQVVRCRDCKSFGIYEYTGIGYCKHDKGLVSPKPDDFCSYGERRGDSETD